MKGYSTNAYLIFVGRDMDIDKLPDIIKRQIRSFPLIDHAWVEDVSKAGKFQGLKIFELMCGS